MCILKTENEKRRKNERSVSLVRFFRALKCVKFCFCVVKYKVIGTIAAVLQMYTFLGAVYICNVHFGAGCLMYWSEAVRSVPGATSEARRERTTVYQSEQAVIGLSPMLIF
jgi:hypothetical protein